MNEKIANPQIVIRPERPDEYPPAIPENDVPLPLRWIRANADGQLNYLA
jgi:hypothetical protein